MRKRMDPRSLRFLFLSPFFVISFSAPSGHASAWSSECSDVTRKNAGVVLNEDRSVRGLIRFASFFVFPPACPRDIGCSLSLSLSLSLALGHDWDENEPSLTISRASRTPGVYQGDASVRIAQGERERDALQIEHLYTFHGHPRTLRRGENLDQRDDSPSAIDFVDARNRQPTSKLVRNAFTCVLGRTISSRNQRSMPDRLYRRVPDQGRCLAV